MNIQKNLFKEKIKNNEVVYGLWVTTANPYMAEMVATIGYDWVLIDGEHGPNTVESLLLQRQAFHGYSNTHPVVRPVESTAANIKQVLDLGYQTVLLPMIDTKEMAEDAIKSVYYAPRGHRGVGASVARASKWNAISDYMDTAEKELCILIQIESITAVKNLDEILSVDGIDGVFIGPADLSTSMGYKGNSQVPEVKQVIKDTITKIKAHGKAAGFLAVDENTAKEVIEWGANFVAVGVDVLCYTESLHKNLDSFK